MLSSAAASGQVVMVSTRLAHTLLHSLSPKTPPFPSSVSSLFSTSSSASPSRTLKTGDMLRRKRTFSEVDLEEFARVTGDANPLHFDTDFAKAAAGFDGRLVHGMLVASLFPAIIASHFPGAIYVSQTLQFKLPVYIGDEIVAQVEPIHMVQRKEKHMVKFLTKCFKRDEQLVLDGEALAILPTLLMKE